MFALAPILALCSCASLHQRVELDKVSTGVPISASKSIVMADGRVVSDDAALSKEAFTINKEVRVPMKAKDAKVDITEDLNKELKGSGCSAVSELKFDLTNIDDSVVEWVSFERGLGAFTAFVGVGFAAIASELPSGQGGGDYLPAVIVAASGAGIFGLSYLHENLGSVDYTIQLTGFKLKY